MVPKHTQIQPDRQIFSTYIMYLKKMKDDKTSEMNPEKLLETIIYTLIYIYMYIYVYILYTVLEYCTHSTYDTKPIQHT